MAWIRVGDESDTHPMLMDLAACEGFDHRTTNEVQGFVMRCAAYSAKHLTDSIVDLGVIALYAGSETQRLVRLCVEVGLMSWVEVDGRRKLKLVEDAEYVHIRTREEIEHDRQQNNDNRNPAIKGPVILRDGDNCRWCETPVYWTGNKSGRFGTLDHLRPGEPGTVETMVVACWSCNSSRKKDESGRWEKEHPLKPVPLSPRYGRGSKKYLEGLGLLEPAAATGDASAVAVGASTSDASLVGVVPGLDGAGNGVEGSVDAGRSLADVDPLEGVGLEGAGPLAVDDPGASCGGLSAGSKQSLRSEETDEFELHSNSIRTPFELHSNSIRTPFDMSTPASLNLPGRVGTGRAGPEREGPGLVGSGSGGGGSGQGQARVGPDQAGPGQVGSRKSRKRRRKRRKR